MLNVFPVLAGRTARHPWRPADLTRVLDAWHRLTPTLHDAAWDTTASLSVFFSGWAPRSLWCCTSAVGALIIQGRMTERGLAAIEVAKQRGTWPTD